MIGSCKATILSEKIHTSVLHSKYTMVKEMWYEKQMVEDLTNAEMSRKRTF